MFTPSYLQASPRQSLDLKTVRHHANDGITRLLFKSLLMQTQTVFQLIKVTNECFKRGCIVSCKSHTDALKERNSASKCQTSFSAQWSKSRVHISLAGHRFLSTTYQLIMSCICLLNWDLQKNKQYSSAVTMLSRKQLAEKEGEQQWSSLAWF